MWSSVKTAGGVCNLLIQPGSGTELLILFAAQPDPHCSAADREFSTTKIAYKLF